MPTPLTFELLPYLGAGPLRFGMQPGEVALLLGEPNLVRTNRYGERDERRTLLAIRFGNNEHGIAEIEFYNDAQVTFQGLNVFEQEEEAYRALLLADGEPFESLGTIVLMKLGITLSPPNNENRTITVFSRGRWDRFIPKLKRLPLSP